MAGLLMVCWQLGVAAVAFWSSFGMCVNVSLGYSPKSGAVGLQHESTLVDAGMQVYKSVVFMYLLRTVT